MKVVAVIPARFGSSRFPGKPLAVLAGKPIIQHVVERTSRSTCVNQVVVATDDDRIYRCVQKFGGTAVMTSPGHPTGTDRIGEVAGNIPCDIVVNVQGDEPTIEPAAIDAAVQPLIREADLPMSTIASPITEPNDLLSPHVVKVVTGVTGDALYFSRSVLPGSREGVYNTASGNYRRHIGLYCFRKEFLFVFVRLERTPLEIAENLEQLRALEHGYRIRVVDAPFFGTGVDTPEDLARLERLIHDGRLVL